MATPEQTKKDRDPAVCKIVHDRVVEIEVVGDKESLFADKETIARLLGDDCGADPKIEHPFNEEAARILVARPDACEICHIRDTHGGRSWCARCSTEYRALITEAGAKFAGTTEECPGCRRTVLVTKGGHFDYHAGGVQTVKQPQHGIGCPHLVDVQRDVLCEHWRSWVYTPKVVGYVHRLVRERRAA